MPHHIEKFPGTKNFFSVCRIPIVEPAVCTYCEPSRAAQTRFTGHSLALVY